MDIHGLFLYLTTFQSKISQHIEEARELNGIGRLARREVLHHGSWGASEQRDPSQKVDTHLAYIILLVSIQAKLIELRDAP